MTQLTNSLYTHTDTHTNQGGLFQRFVEAFRTMQQKRRTRRELTNLPDYLLKDLGISREDIRYEMKKSFWLLK